MAQFVRQLHKWYQMIVHNLDSVDSNPWLSETHSIYVIRPSNAIKNKLTQVPVTTIDALVHF